MSRTFSLPKTFDATNFIKEGPTIMSVPSTMDFLPRCSLLLILKMMSLLPPSMGVIVDSDAFLGSFSYVDDDGVRKKVGGWDNGPGWRRSLQESSSAGRASCDDNNVYLSQADHLETQLQIWKEHENKYGAHIPSAVCCIAGITPLEGWSEGDSLDKIKPLLFNKGKGKASDKSKDKSQVCEDINDSSEGCIQIQLKLSIPY